MPATLDPTALGGKLAPPETRTEVLVIGGGPAGLAAAIALAEGGAAVMLVDENPLDPELVGLDVPLYFGGRAGAALQTPARLVERLLDSDPAIAAAFEAGVDVQLGQTCWGLYLPGPASRELPGPIAGLTDGSRTWTVGFDRVVVASGARDFVVFFEGADQPGVMGASAFHSLVTRYDAFDGRRLVIGGSGGLAVDTAELALAHGIEVAALVDVTAEPRADAHRIAALAARGVAIRLGATIAAAGRGPFGVSHADIVDASGNRETFACDTVCLAFGRVPAIELFDAAGLRMRLDGLRGGFAPETPDGFSTSSPLVFGAGDCMGVGETPVSRTGAEASGRRAAAAVLKSLGRRSAPLPVEPEWLVNGNTLAYRRTLVEAMLTAGGADVLACQCEEVTRGDLLNLRAPRYLGPPTERSLCRTLATHAGEGPLSHDQMKRLTRVSMGACQARRCREQVALLMAIGAGIPLEAIPLAGHRAPVRPLPLRLLATLAETPDMAEHWPVWFGIPTQWVPYDLIGTPGEQDVLAQHMHL